MVEERPSGNEPAQPRLRIGFALLPKKVSRYLTRSMMDGAAARGMVLQTVVPELPLGPQGHFDAIVHKLQSHPVFEAHLAEYAAHNPGACVVDSLSAIRTLHNRGTMLSTLQSGGVVIEGPTPSAAPPNPGAVPPIPPPPRRARVASPVQVEIPEGSTHAQALALLAGAGLVPPLLVKPVWTDGREGSHGLAVLHSLARLPDLLSGAVSAKLRPPLIVQQFVQHGGVIYKVYVVGQTTVVVRRPSLGDLYLGAAAQAAGVVLLPRISCKPNPPPCPPPAAASAAPGRGAAVPPTSSHGANGAGGASAASASGVSPPAGGTGSAASRVLSEPGPGTAAAAGAGAAAVPPAMPEAGGTRSGTAGGTEAHGSRAGATPPPRPPLGAAPPSAVAPPSSAVARPPPALELPRPRRDSTCGGALSGDLGSSSQTRPLEWMSSGLASCLRQRLGMQLFNFDLICPDDQPHPEERLYFVIDINYFPGVDKVPNFQNIFLDFLEEACAGSASHAAAAQSACSPAATGQQQQQQPETQPETQQQQHQHDASAGPHHHLHPHSHHHPGLSTRTPSPDSFNLAQQQQEAGQQQQGAGQHALRRDVAVAAERHGAPQLRSLPAEAACTTGDDDPAAGPLCPPPPQPRQQQQQSHEHPRQGGGAARQPLPPTLPPATSQPSLPPPPQATAQHSQRPVQAVSPPAGHALRLSAPHPGATLRDASMTAASGASIPSPPCSVGSPSQRLGGLGEQTTTLLQAA